MTLSFSTKINGKPNFFIEKIYSGLESIYPVNQDYHDYIMRHNMKFGKDWDKLESKILPNYQAKIHTIRRDKSNRWKEGINIHFVINNRTKDRFQFAPIFKVTKIQKIEIYHVGCFAQVKIDNKVLPADKHLQLAINDGFKSVEYFFEFFNSDFVGKIIHWTNHKY